MNLPHSYCSRCSLQFGKKKIFDMHVSLVHKEKVETKEEPKSCGNAHIESMHEEKQALKCEM